MLPEAFLSAQFSADIVTLSLSLRRIPIFMSLPLASPHGLTLIPAWISNYNNYEVWDEITHPFPNFKSYIVENLELISNFISHFNCVRITVCFACELCSLDINNYQNSHQITDQQCQRTISNNSHTWSCIKMYLHLKPTQNGRHSADDIFKCIFFNENVWIPIKISLKFVPKGSINNIPVLV